MKKSKLFPALAAAAFSMGVMVAGIAAADGEGNTPTVVQSPVVLNGWQTMEDGKTYYYEDGNVAKGWKNVEGDWYFCDKTTGERLDNHWEKSGNYWYFTGSEGVMVTDGMALDTDGKIYMFDQSGKMQKGWVNVNAGTSEPAEWYYFSPTTTSTNPAGSMVTGWAKVNNKWYYMDEDGVMQTGFVNVNGKEYYLLDSGAMVTGWKKVGEDWYYFNASGAKQTHVWVSNKYYLNSDGVMITNSYVTNGTRYWWVNAKGEYVSKYTITDKAKAESYGYSIYSEATGEVVFQGNK